MLEVSPGNRESAAKYWHGQSPLEKAMRYLSRVEGFIAVCLGVCSQAYAAGASRRHSAAGSDSLRRSFRGASAGRCCGFAMAGLVAIGKSLELLAVWKIDCSGQVICPGFYRSAQPRRSANRQGGHASEYELRDARLHDDRHGPNCGSGPTDVAAYYKTLDEHGAGDERRASSAAGVVA